MTVSIARYKKTGRIMLGGDECPEMIIYVNAIFADGPTLPPFGDCEIRFYLGGRPILLHNDTSDLDPIVSIDQYIDKLNKIKSTIVGVYKHAIKHPNTNYLIREFLNPPQPDTRLFGGTLLGHFHAKYKVFTLDICDCSNKSRKTFKHYEMDNFCNKLTEIIDESLISVREVREKLNEHKQPV